MSFSQNSQSVSSCDRFLKKVKKPGLSGCWIWVGARNKTGYGVLKINGKNKYAHHVAFDIFCDHFLQNGDRLSHSCGNRICVNPKHLYILHAEDISKQFKDRNSKQPSKLTSMDVDRIHFLAQSGYSISRLAKDFGVSRTTIQKVKRRHILKDYPQQISNESHQAVMHKVHDKFSWISVAPDPIDLDQSWSDVCL